MHQWGGEPALAHKCRGKWGTRSQLEGAFEGETLAALAISPLGTLLRVALEKERVDYTRLHCDRHIDRVASVDGMDETDDKRLQVDDNTPYA